MDGEIKEEAIFEKVRKNCADFGWGVECYVECCDRDAYFFGFI